MKSVSQLTPYIIQDYELNGRKSIRRLKTTIEPLHSYFAAIPASNIKYADLLNYITHRKSAGKANATILRELAILHRIFKLALLHEDIQHIPPFPTIAINNARTGFLEFKDFKRILSHLPEHLVGPITFAYYTGWRIGEILSLKWEDVNRQECLITLNANNSKNNESRVFPYKHSLAITRLIEKQHTRRGELSTGQGVSLVFPYKGHLITSYRSSWNKATRSCGLSGALVHDLRRTAVRNLERAGISRSVAMKITGHKTESIYRRYAIVNKQDIEDAIKKLNK